MEKLRNATIPTNTLTVNSDKFLSNRSQYHLPTQRSIFITLIITGVLTCESIPQFDEEAVEQLLSVLQYEDLGRFPRSSRLEQIYHSSPNIGHCYQMIYQDLACSDSR